MDREVDPNATRYTVLAIPLEDYADLDAYERMADRMLDLNWVITCLQLRDVFSFPASYLEPKQQ
jgi:hypothetical protein